MRRFALFFVVPCLVLACGGADQSPLLGDDGGGGGGDGGGGGNDAPVADNGGGCDITHCATLPDGFRAVAMVDANATCPSGFTTADMVTEPAASDGACTCACNVTTQPDCTMGAIARSLDATAGPTCGSPATTFQANGGACSAVGNGGISFSYYHYATNPAPPSAGACQYDATVDTSKVTSKAARLCAPPASCVGALCGQPNVCIAHDGDVACPGDFPAKALVGTGASADCAACGGSCTLKAECSGTLGFFTDAACTQGEVDFTADGVCTANTSLNTGPFDYYQYTGTLKSAACAGNVPTSTATAKLDGTTTVCCHN